MARVLFLQDSGINESLAVTELSAWLTREGHHTHLLLLPPHPLLLLLLQLPHPLCAGSKAGAMAPPFSDFLRRADAPWHKSVRRG